MYGFLSRFLHFEPKARALHPSIFFIAAFIFLLLHRHPSSCHGFSLQYTSVDSPSFSLYSAMPALSEGVDFAGGPFHTDNHPSSPSLADAVAFALQKYPGFSFLPSNYDSIEPHCRNASPSATAHFCRDDFRMYEFKVRRCMRGRSHDWTECPFAHPGEKARRRDPRRIHYSGAPCPDFRKGSCRRGDVCEFAHGVFECWLHPARYRTQVCKDGKNCKRRVCFFAHSPEQLRVLPSLTSTYGTSTESAASGSPVGSPGGFLSQQNFSSEIPSGSSDETSAAFISANYNCKKALVMHPPTHQVSPISIHLDSLNAGSPLCQAMAQSFLLCKGYGGGSFNFNAAKAKTAESTLLFESCDAPCMSLHLPHGSYNATLQEGGVSKVSLPLGCLDNGHSYDLGSYSHGFASPTSTLAGHTFSPPPMSPPLTPLSTPNPDNGQIKGTISNPGLNLHNFYMDDTVNGKSINEPTQTYSKDCMEDLSFRLQHLQAVEPFQRVGFSLENPHESRYGMLETMPLESPQSRLSSLKHVTSGLSCTQKSSLWRRPNEFFSEDYGLDLLQSKDSSVHEMAAKVYGEESFADNLIPDFGWVSELVK